MANFVCNGAKMKCSFGDLVSNLMILPDKMVMVDGQPMANIMDMKPMVNILPFGMCKSLANPQVAAATAAALGVLTPMPCIPNTVAPWAPGAPTMLLKNMPALLDNCKLMCLWGGVIQINNHGQTGSDAAAKINSRGHQFDTKSFGGGAFEIEFGF